MRSILLAVALIWNSNTEPDLAGYTVYRGPKSGTYTTRLNVGNVTTNELAPGIGEEFFAVTASNTSGLESDFSNEVTIVWPFTVQIKPCDGVTLSWASVPGASYRVSCTVDASVTWYGWVDLTSDLVATGTAMGWSEPITETERFYRVACLQ